jgi:hypothetical protein
MTGPAALGLVSWLAVAASFYAFKRAFWFSAASVVVIFAFVVASAGRQGMEAPDRAAIAVGLTAWWLGLLLVRTMITRSISLTLLIAFANHANGDIQESVARRLDEAAKYGLAVFDGRQYTLARLGRIVTACARVAYLATGSPA